ncbi:hypothetical protein RIF29_36851 [Crotalaria pallida]|uniref:YDG domain-containing protein n=1 Tax=Crotalaria pallida TaxID=3830 RepID=A0AAN9EE10_CROPI
MAASDNNGYSEERSGKRLKENEDCTSLSRTISKRQKVCAIRDFPDGCGPFASSVDPVLNVDIADFSSVNKDDSQHSELKKDSFLTETLCQTADYSLTNENPVVSSCPVDGLPLANGDPVDGFPLALEDTGLTLGQTMDCSLKNENPAVSSHHVDGFLLENNDPAEVPLVGMNALEDTGLTLGQTTDCSLKNENPVFSSPHMDGLPSANDDPEKALLVGMEALENTGLTVIANSVKCESSMSKPLSPIGEVALSGGSKSLCNVIVSGSSASIEKATHRRYVPHKKRPAIRDFPPFCGRNAPFLSKDELLKEISLNNKRVGQQNLAVDDNSLEKIATFDLKEKENNIQDENACVRKLVDTVKADPDSKKVRRFEPSGSKLAQENTREKFHTLPQESNHHLVEINSKTVVEEGNGDPVQVEGTSGPEIMACPEVQIMTSKVKFIDGASENKGKKDGFFSRLDRSKVAIKGKYAPNHSGQESLKKVEGTSGPEITACPEVQIMTAKVKFIDGASENNGKKEVFLARLDRSKTAIKGKCAPNHSGQESSKKVKGIAASDGMGQSHGLNASVPSSGHGSFGGRENGSNVARDKVMRTLRMFRKLLQELECNSIERANRRIDLQAAKILKDSKKYVNTGNQILGSIPGVEVGDEFQYRVELNMIGLHRQIQGGIDYVKLKGKIVASSIVASGGYADELDSSDELIYTGQGGNVMCVGKEPEDQKLERGNLALKNSIEEKNPVRVIRGYEAMTGKPKALVYDGLYLVQSCWQDRGPHGKLVYQFRLRRIPGQRELAMKKKKSKMWY